MSFKKTALASVSDPSVTVSDWENMYGAHSFQGCNVDTDHPFCKTASMKKLAAKMSKYLLSHCTIMASVQTELEPRDHLIKPECSHLVNNNDDCWSNEVLKLSHETFIGAFNFVEHFQNSKYAKGHILSSVLRKISLGTGVWVYYCDILVATDVSHKTLVDDIRAGKVKYLSMGCVTDLVICSYCGARVNDQGSYCSHLAYQKGQFIPDEDGIFRRIAELCGHKSLPNGGVKFVEASWVATPAFPGAVKQSIIYDGWIGPGSPYTSEINVESEKEAACFRKSASTAVLGDMNFPSLESEMEQLARTIKNKE